MKKLNKIYHKIHFLKYIQLTSIFCFPPSVNIFFKPLIIVSLIVLMTGLSIRVTPLHMSWICAPKQQYVPHSKFNIFWDTLLEWVVLVSRSWMALSSWQKHVNLKQKKMGTAQNSIMLFIVVVEIWECNCECTIGIMECKLFQTAKHKTSLLRRLEGPSRYNSTSRQNPPLPQNRRNF